jgi:hypothetical protein
MTGPRLPGRRGGALFVSPSGSAASRDHSCDSAGYSTIQSDVAAAPTGGTVAGVGAPVFTDP